MRKVVFLLALVMLGSLWWGYRGIYDSYKRLEELRGYDDLGKVKYCLKYVEDEEWRRYRGDLYSERIEVRDGIRTIGWDNFRVSLQVHAIPDAFLSKIEPDEDGIPTISMIEPDLKFLCSYEMKDDIWIREKHSESMEEIYWDTARNEYIPDGEIEKRLGISTDDIVSALETNRAELIEISNQMMQSVISEKEAACREQIRYTIYMTVFYGVAVVGGIWYYRHYKPDPKKSKETILGRCEK